MVRSNEHSHYANMICINNVPVLKVKQNFIRELRPVCVLHLWCDKNNIPHKAICHLPFTSIIFLLHLSCLSWFSHISLESVMYFLNISYLFSQIYISFKSIISQVYHISLKISYISLKISHVSQLYHIFLSDLLCLSQFFHVPICHRYVLSRVSYW